MFDGVIWERYIAGQEQTERRKCRGILTVMPRKIGFDNEQYLEEQTAAILERVDHFNDKLYLEFGGKLLFDYHAARVLPGFDPNVKMRLLQKLKDKTDVILCIYAGDIV